MSWSQSKNCLLAKVNFPPYTIQMLTSRHVLVGGGGGSSRTGVANGFEIFELFHDGYQYVAEEVTRYETGPNVVMNSAVFNDGKKIWLLAGQESHCQLYTIESKINTKANGEISRRNSQQFRDGLRARNRNSNIGENANSRKFVENVMEERHVKNKHKLVLEIKPSDSIQTDFGTSPVQRVVRISPDGKQMATGGTDGLIRLWEFPAMKLQYILNGHSKEIDDIDYSHNSKYLSTISKDGLLLLWDPSTGRKAKSLSWKTNNNKSIFKRCRFPKSIQATSKINHLFTLSNSLPPTNKKSRGNVHSGFLQLWNVELNVVERVVVYKETLSELAVSDDGKFVAVGTMSTGTVDMYIGFSLQRILHVPSAHNMFITNLAFLPTHLNGPAITSNAEAAVISVSVDNKICVHSIPYRHGLPFWLFLIFIILSICGAFIVCSYLGL